MQENEARYTEVIKLFGLVLNQYRLYSERHPAAQLAVQNFQARLEAILAAESTFTLGAAGGRLIVNDLPLDAKQNGAAALLNDCERLAIESLTFEQGPSSDEIVAFFKLMALPPKILQEKGGFAQAFALAGLQRVRLGTVRYLAVGENAAVEVEIKRTGELVFPLERCADTAKVELMVKAYREGDQQALENSARLCRRRNPPDASA